MWIPDGLSLQSRPMTEPLLFGTTFLAVALIAEWAPHVEPPTPNHEPPTCALRPPTSRAAGCACIAAVMTRYEAWPIVASAIVLSGLVLLRRGWSVAAVARAIRGLALWPLW